MEIVGNIAAVFISIVLGMMGGGGSILTVPVLVYLLHLDAITATTYSLFIVGVTSLTGGTRAYIKKQVDFKAVSEFGIPSIFSIFIARHFILPAVPEKLFSIGNIEVTRGVAKERSNTGGCVEGADRVAKERKGTGGRVVVGCVAHERSSTGGCVAAAGDVVMERLRTCGRVVVAVHMAVERLKADRRILATGCKTEERIVTLGGISAEIAAVRRRKNRSSRRRERKAGQGEC